MPYKKIYYTIHCPKCNMDYQVLPQAYFRKLKDTKYGLLCKSCRAKVQWEEMTDEEKQKMNKLSHEASKNKYNNLSDSDKNKLKQKRANGVKEYWNSLSDEERKQISDKRSKDRIDYLSNITDIQKKEIGNKISATKLQISANMSDDKKAERKRKKQEERKTYWNNLTNEKREEISELLRNLNKEYWDNITSEELEKRSKTMSKCSKEYWNSKTPEERIDICQNMINGNKQWRENLSDEEIQEINKKISESLTLYWNSLSDEERKQISKSRSEARNKWLSSLSDDEYNAYVKHISDNMKSYWDNLTEYERKQRDSDNRNRWNNLPDDIKESIIRGNVERWDEYTQEQKDEIRNKQINSFKHYIDSLSTEERMLISKRAKDAWNNKSEEERNQQLQGLMNWRKNLSEEERYEEIRKQHQWLQELTDEKRILLNNKLINSWKNMSVEKRDKILKKIFADRPKNSLQNKFEKTFNSSHLSNQYYFKPEVILTNETIHSWDYGIYSKDTNELVMVVDLDGSYFHADECDYDGIHSKEEYDEKRIISIPTISNIRPFIIQELNFKKCFEMMIKMLLLNYDEYVDHIFNMCRIIPFPSPKYTDRELYKSFSDLCKMKCNDKYHNNISLNTRIGDRIIQHFHESIYHANRKGSISPYDAWYDDKLLKECIKNRIIYQSYLNPNKILQGFNISKVAQKVSVFSAGRAKMLINKYLSDCNTIFDPFSGFSGRMLGAVSLGKRYIGQDISPIHVRESNNMIKSLNINNAIIIACDILKSNGEYECLFTCSPYQDIEQWLDVPVSKRTCDDWIDECLSRFKCKKYLFVVDYTERYLDYVVDEIKNKSHFGSNSEYVILIQK